MDGYMDGEQTRLANGKLGWASLAWAVSEARGEEAFLSFFLGWDRYIDLGSYGVATARTAANPGVRPCACIHYSLVW